MDFQIKVNRSD